MWEVETGPRSSSNFCDEASAFRYVRKYSFLIEPRPTTTTTTKTWQCCETLCATVVLKEFVVANASTLDENAFSHSLVLYLFATHSFTPNQQLGSCPWSLSNTFAVRRFHKISARFKSMNHSQTGALACCVPLTVASRLPLYERSMLVGFLWIRVSWKISKTLRTHVFR